MIKTTVKGVDQIKRELEDLVKRFDVPMVTVGIHEDATDPPDGEINMATLGAVHEFGANIKHPGGTAYGYKSKAAAERGEVRFMKAGAGHIVLGTTKAHDINIPSRAFLQPGFESGVPEYTEVMAEGIEEATEGGSMTKTLKKIGVLAVSKVQQFMTDLKAPANKPGTVKRKGSANPLIDTGLMRGSINFRIQPQKPEEGL
jgi:hypothetical protein